MKKLVIVILNYNTKELLARCINSIFSIKIKAKRILIEVVVVDNNSTDGSINNLKTQNSKLKTTSENLKLEIIENKENLGFTAGNNVGIKYAMENNADYVMILNSDTFAKDAFWEPMIEALDKDDKFGVVAPKIYFASGYEFHKARYKENERGKVFWSTGGLMDWKNLIGSNRGVDEVDKGQYDQEEEVENASGCCLIARSEVWKKVGLFDERYFMYYEDADLCERMKKFNYQVLYIPKAKIWHLNAGSSGIGGSLQDYFIARNRLLFGLRWAPFRTKLALTKESFKILIFGRKWQKLGVKDFYLRKFGKGSWKN